MTMLEKLKSEGIAKFYHFTDRDNLQSIVDNGGLYSWDYCERNNIQIPKPGGDSTSRDLDRCNGHQNYVRVSFTRNHPMMYVAQKDGRITNPVILEISLDVVLRQGTLFSDKNAVKSDAHIGATYNDLCRIHFATVKSRTHFDVRDEERDFFQAEVLIPEHIPLEMITNISSFGIVVPKPKPKPKPTSVGMITLPSLGIFFKPTTSKLQVGKYLKVPINDLSRPAPPTMLPDRLNFAVHGVAFSLVYVQGGTFTMGATAEQGYDADDDERPTHSVTLDDYYMADTQVTQALWRAVMGTNPSYFKGDDHPVGSVSWEDCQRFLRKLNGLLSGQLAGKSFTLPTEAQWEYAARGGCCSRGYKYAGSSNLDAVAWYGGNAGRTTHAVGQKQANELGLYDMSGNVWEWCSDWYGYYTSQPSVNPMGPSSWSGSVLRGGSWFDCAGNCRVSRRNSDGPSYCGLDFGLRLSLSLR